LSTFADPRKALITRPALKGGVPVVKLQCQLDMPTQDIAMFTGIPGPGEL
jgi:hypothetical protein